MNFEYDDTPDVTRNPVAWLYRMDGPFSADSDLGLCIATTDPDKYIWAYSDGEISTHSTGPSGAALKVFYEGDSLNITF